MKRFVSVTEQFLPQEMYTTLRNFAETTDIFEQNIIPNSVWSQRVVHANQIPDDIKNIGKQFIELVKEKIITDFEIDKPIYTDIFCFNRWRTGDLQYAHADDMNGYDWRKFGCVLYLNEEYEGGEIIFPTKFISLKPKANTLAFFPGDKEFLHGVSEITSGVRYTISTFWTYDANLAVKI